LGPQFAIPHQKYRTGANNAIRFISKLKGRDSITAARDKLNLETLTDRRFKLRHKLLLRLLSNEENHASLTNSYDELVNSKTQNTRASSKGNPPTIFAKSAAYYSSFLRKK